MKPRKPRKLSVEARPRVGPGFFMPAAFMARDYLVHTLRVLRQHVCAYEDVTRGITEGARCDCKYGVGDVLNAGHETESGCCELTALAHILSTIQKREWEAIVKRAGESPIRPARYERCRHCKRPPPREKGVKSACVRVEKETAELVDCEVGAYTDL